MRRQSERKLWEVAGWVAFILSAIGFIIASIGDPWSEFASITFLLGCIFALVPYLPYYASSEDEGNMKNADDDYTHRIETAV